MTTPTTHYGFGKPTVGGSADTWGTELNGALDAIDTALYGVSQNVPSCAVMDFLLTAAPAGWLELNGNTIGDASSGAFYAAPDAYNVFVFLWSNFNNTYLPIKNSDGTAGTRGATAADDFAAHKRMPLIDQRDRFRRSYKPGGNSAAIGIQQADNIGPVTTTSVSSGPGPSVLTTSGGSGETRPLNISYLTCIKL